MDKRHLMADLAIVEIVNADKRNWTWEKAEIEDGEFWVPQGSYLGNTTINLGDIYETSGDDCLYVQTACENYPEVLRRAIDAEERLAKITEQIEQLLAVLHPDSGETPRREEVYRFLRNIVAVSPNEGGCWFCYRKSDGMLFDTEFDTYLHEECLRKELAENPDNPEARVMSYLLDGGVAND